MTGRKILDGLAEAIDHASGTTPIQDRADAPERFNCSDWGSGAFMERAPDGDYVDFEDHTAAIAELDALLDDAVKALEVIGSCLLTLSPEMDAENRRHARYALAKLRGETAPQTTKNPP